MIRRAFAGLRASLLRAGPDETPVNDPLAPFADYLRGSMSSAGVRMNADRAMRVSAVAGCVRILAEGVGSLPFKVYRRLPNGGKEEATDHPAWRLLTMAPNQRHTPEEYFSLQQRDLELEGNALAIRVRTGMTGPVRELVPIEWRRVTVREQTNGRLVYEVASKGMGSVDRFPEERVLHVRGPFGDAVCGASVVSEFTDLFGLAYAIQQYLGYTFKNGTRLSGVLQTDTALSSPALIRLKEQFKEKYAGVGNAGETLILEEGLKFNAVAQTNRDAQTVELQDKVDSGIARVFSVPLHMLAQHIAQPRANMEQAAREFVQNALRSRIRRVEARYDLDVLGGDPEFFCRFDLDELLRGDAKTRADVDAVYLDRGVKNANEVRGGLGLNPRAGGDTYVRPLNMSDDSSQADEDPPAPREPVEEQDARTPEQLMAAAFDDALGPALRRLRAALEDEERSLNGAALRN